MANTLKLFRNWAVGFIDNQADRDWNNGFLMTRAVRVEPAFHSTVMRTRTGTGCFALPPVKADCSDTVQSQLRTQFIYESCTSEAEADC
jgi:hypothetical protein